MSPEPAPRPLAADRERVVQALCLHFAADHLEMDELDDRLARVYGAQSLSQLQGLVADLPSFSGEQFDVGSGPILAPSAAIPSRGVIMAMMGGAERKGSWLIPRELKVVVVMGGAQIDLREGRFAPGVTEIEVTALMGGVEIIVPLGVRVETFGAAFMGGFASDAGDAAALDPHQPVLRVSGLAIMAGVHVKVRRPSKKTLKKFEAAVTSARQLLKAPFVR